VFRSFLLIFFFLVGGLIIQGTLIHSLIPAAVAPDIILILSVFLALRFPSVWGMISVYAIGIAGDFASGQFVGPIACGCVVAFALTIYASKKVYLEHPVTLGLVILGVSICKSIVFLLMVSFYVEEAAVWTFYSARLIVVEAALSGLIGPFITEFLDRAMFSSAKGRSRSIGSSVSRRVA